MLEIVYVENNEQSLWENNEQFYLMQKTYFMNAVRYNKHDVQRENFINIEIDFINAEKQIRSY